jgi:CHAT domain-containing protein
MDNDLFLQRLRELNLEEGKAYIQEHIEELTDHVAIGNLLAEEALRLLYTPFVSLKVAELLIFSGEYVQHLSSHALGLKAKGDALVQIGHYRAAIECLNAAGEEFLSLGDKGNWARSRISWITACMWLDRVEEALQEGNRARDVFLQLGEYYWVCVIDHNIALIYYYIGHYQDALKLYESMLSIYPSLTDQSETFVKRSIAIAEVNQALTLALLGNFKQAYYLQQQAQASFIALKEVSCVISTEINLAELDYVEGYYGSTLRRYYHARDLLMQDNLDNPLLLAELKFSMGNCLVKLNRAQEACQLANEAVEIYRQSGNLLSTGIALRGYATTLAASGRSKEALVTLEEAWTLFNSGGFNLHASASKLHQAELLLEIGTYAEAYNHACLVREYFDAQGLVERSVRASLVMASALIERAQQPEVQQRGEQLTSLLQEAKSLCRQAASQARPHNLQEVTYKSHYLLGRLYILQNNYAKAARHYAAAIAQIERILDDLIYDLSPSFLHTAWAVYEDMIALCLQQSQFERAFDFLEQARSMALRQYLNKTSIRRDKGGEREDSIPSTAALASGALMLRVQQELKDWQERYHNYSALLANIDTSVSPSVDREVIQAELKRCEAKVSELFERMHLYQSDVPLKSHTRKRASRHEKENDIMQLRQHLSPDQLLLAYYLHKSRLVIFAISTERLITYENPEGMPQLERLLPLLHAHLRPQGWPTPQQPPQQAIRGLLKKLYDLLMAPVASLLPSPPGYLTIVPYGALHNLPFHALYDGSHFLIEDYQVNYLPASNILVHLDTPTSEQVVRPTDQESSARSPLVFGYSGNGYLQRALEEARTLATTLNGRCYLEGEATIARLIAEAPGSSIIHLATHGHSRLDAPNFSYVRLADGQLNAIDAFSLNLKGCELVTLSGCETGLALSSGGDEQLGLGRAFLAAGATSLVMSLWPVEDNATNELMQLFYQHLLHGESKVQALRAAQCSLLHRAESIYTHPYFWAAFRLVGDVGPLHVGWEKEEHTILETKPPKKVSFSVS